MKILHCDVDGQPVSKADCRGCALTRGLHINPLGKRVHCRNPTPYIMMLTQEDRSRDGVGVSATMLASDCYRQAIWREVRDYAIYPRTEWAAAHGTMMHDQMHRYTEQGTIAEDRFFCTMPSGRQISGAIDR
ncbi:MAG TPA: hypothetical protein VH593_30725, partial [Ktedonobacteraceae bacterium]